MTIKLAIDTSRANAQSGQATKFAESSAPAAKAPPMRLIAGPCLLESRDHCMRMADALISITSKFPVRFIFKASFEKANRTRYDSPRMGLPFYEAVKVLETLRERVPVLTDCHDPTDTGVVGDCVDVIQIPALLSRQTSLIEHSAREASGINIKKGQFMSPEDVIWVVEKAKKANPNCHVMVTERGYTFGYHNLVVDMRSFPIMKATSGADEILFDATHSVQLPSSATDGTSGGLREFIDPLARAAIVSGADGLFCEVHDDPQHALSDGPCQIPLHRFEDFLRRILELRAWAQANPLSSLSPLE